MFLEELWSRFIHTKVHVKLGIKPESSRSVSVTSPVAPEKTPKPASQVSIPDPYRRELNRLKR